MKIIPRRIWQKKTEGGGSLLCLSHHIDLYRYLIGPYTNAHTYYRKKSKLKIDVEDSFYTIISSKKKVFSINLNFLDNPPKNYIIINFQKKTIKWDYLKSQLKFMDIFGKEIKIINFKNFKRNDMFKNQTLELLNSVLKKEKINCDLEEGIQTLKMCIKLKKNGIKK